MADDRSQAWKAHADDQAQAWARLSHLERLRWLQSAKQFAKLATDAAARRFADGTADALPLAVADPALEPALKPTPG